LHGTIKNVQENYYLKYWTNESEIGGTK
jgi:hypothetical protein